MATQSRERRGSGSRHSIREREVIEEEIHFNADDGRDGYVVRDQTTLISVHPTSDDLLFNRTNVSDSKFKFRSFVDYTWEAQQGTGRMISTHISGKFIAYVVKVNHQGAVRVVDLDTNERALMKGAKGLIRDVEFIHKTDTLVVGFIDEMGTFFVVRVLKDMKTHKLSHTKILQVSLEGSIQASDMRRFIWCKYVPDDNQNHEIPSPRDFAFHFAVLQNDVVYVMNLVQVVHRYGEGDHTLNQIRGNFMTIDAHSDSVVDASFAPDGTALATASRDGTVKFFQIYLVGDETPRCLYSWAPHRGRPIAKIFFLDDHSIGTAADSQYWKFMITASEHMAELKLWTCKTWQCLQTLQFANAGSLGTQLKMEIDISAHLIVMTEVKRKLLYTLHLKHDDNNACVDWVKEFILPFNMLSYNVHVGSLVTYRQLIEKGYEEYFPDGITDLNQSDNFAVLEMYFIQPKSLQQGTIAFRPPTTSSRANGHSRLSINSTTDEELAEITRHSRNSSDDDESRLANMLATKSTIALANPGSRSHSRDKDRRTPPPEIGKIPSPNADRTPVTVMQMSEQLSSMMGLLSGGAPNSVGLPLATINAKGRSRSRSPHLLSNETLVIDEEVMNGHIVHPSVLSTNGDASKTSSSSSPSREVEEILSPKNPDLIGHSSLENMIVVNSALDVEGNIPDLATVAKQLVTLNPIIGGVEIMPQLPQVLEQVNSIMDMMKIQSLEIKELRNEVSRLHNAQAAGTKNLDETQLSRFMEKQTHSHNSRIEELLLEVLHKQNTAHSASSSIPANLAEVLATSIGKIIKSEIEQNVLPALVNEFEPTRNNIHAEVKKLVIVAEAKLKQDMAQIIGSQDFRRALIPDVGSAIKGICEGVVSEMFISQMLPRFEKSLQGVYGQINETFHKGTKEYMNGLESVLEHERKHDNVQEYIKMQVNNLHDNLLAGLQTQSENLVTRVTGGLQENVVKQIQDSLTVELTRAFKEQQRYFDISVVARALTPAVSVSDHMMGAPVGNDPAQMQKQVVQMVKSGDIPGAFAQAIHFGDNNVLMYLCKNVNSAKVFTNKLPTVTHLALLQHMASDILQDTETKLNYLQTAMSSLDLNDRNVLQCVSRVAPVFQASVSRFQTLNPDSKLIGHMKLLEMAFCGVGGQMQLQSPHSAADFTRHQILGGGKM